MPRSWRVSAIRLSGCLFVLVTAALARTGEAKVPEPDSVQSSELRLSFPGPSRADLELPSVLWDEVRREIDGAPPTIGYGPAEMKNFGRDLFLLPGVLRLFADARKVPRFSGRVTDGLLDEARDVAAFGAGWSDGGLGELARRAYLLLDVSAGRRINIEPDSSLALPFALDADRAKDWKTLPDTIRRLVCQLYRGAEAAGPWVRAAFDQELLRTSSGHEDATGVESRELYPLAMSLRNDEHLDQLASLETGALRLLETTDLAYLAYATVLWLRHVEHALHAFHAAAGAESGLDHLSVPTFSLSSPLGTILIGGTGDDEHDTPAFLIVDIGGRDQYGAGLAASSNQHSPITLLLDLSGSDRYVDPGGRDPENAEVVPSFGAGVFGLAALLDLAGSDQYEVNESGLGRGCYGTGLLVDFGGDDSYYGGGRWTQGSAHTGIGILLDLGGDDVYSGARESQGLGATLGTGLLLDLEGNDRYEIRDDANISELYENQTVAMSQGCGYGRRADLGDGHSLAGGFGLLVDGAGNDDYHAQVWSQGCGYWWGVGILEDRAGDDRYRNGKYSSGAAAHFAIGIHVDLAGNDIYNVANDTAKNQFQGHARDGAIGVFIDGQGADHYEFRSHCAGSGDLASIGLFWDRQGVDHYAWQGAYRDSSDWAMTPPMGSTTRYELSRSFRDDLPVLGIFLDTGGSDVYDTAGIGANDTVWRMTRYENAWGIGYDRDHYLPAEGSGGD